MVTIFRKLLIRLGKVVPFVCASIVSLGYCENIYAILSNNIVKYYDGEMYFHTPISNFIGDAIYIDWFDVLLLYILAFALELCKYNFRCVHYLLLNLAVRCVLEHILLDEWLVITISYFMALCGIICAFGGIKALRAYTKITHP